MTIVRCKALNGAGVESMQAKWEEMFGVKEEVMVKEVKFKKPRRKAAKEIKKIATKKKYVKSNTGKTRSKTPAKNTKTVAKSPSTNKKKVTRSK